MGPEPDVQFLNQLHSELLLNSSFKMQSALWTIGTPDFRVIAAVNLNQLAIPSIIKWVYFAATPITNSKHFVNC